MNRHKKRSTFRRHSPKVVKSRLHRSSRPRMSVNVSARPPVPVADPVTERGKFIRIMHSLVPRRLRVRGKR